ncbi:DUF692 domain-containing protein [Polaromonas sp. P1(28)-13]|nr:DUF692 domain-containing protein [Polaromonas sp. P1(28)-13]
MTGIGWRHPHYGELLQRAEGPQRPALDFIEVHSENFLPKVARRWPCWPRAARTTR